MTFDDVLIYSILDRAYLKCEPGHFKLCTEYTEIYKLLSNNILFGRNQCSIYIGVVVDRNVVLRFGNIFDIISKYYGISNQYGYWVKRKLEMVVNVGSTLSDDDKFDDYDDQFLLRVVSDPHDVAFVLNRSNLTKLSEVDYERISIDPEKYCEALQGV